MPLRDLPFDDLRATEVDPTGGLESCLTGDRIGEEAANAFAEGKATAPPACACILFAAVFLLPGLSDGADRCRAGREDTRGRSCGVAEDLDVS